jgi:fimbrial isopeptide formation D2 family protein
MAILMSVFPQSAAAKSLYLCSEHHQSQFDAWNVNPNGTVIKQATYTLMYATDPAGIAIDEDSETIFITSEFSGGVEIVDPVTLTYLGVSSGPSNLAGIAVDDADDIVYTVQRSSPDLYIYRWDSASLTLVHLATITLPNCIGAFGLALDEFTDILWVADTGSGTVRAYDVDVATWNDIAEIPAMRFSPSHKPVDVAVDRIRNLVYTVSIRYGASTPGGTGSNLLSKYDVSTKVETTVDMGYAGVGVAVDEITGLVYVTGGAYSGEPGNLSVWDCSVTPFTKIQDTGHIGNPAGICIANVSYNPLNLAKNDVIVGQGVYIGQTFTYEITCDNKENAFDVTNATVVDTLPPELDYVSSAIDGVPQPASVYDPGTHTVTWHIGTIAAGGEGPLIELVVKVNKNATPASTIYNYCTIDSDQTPPTTVIGGDPDDPTGEPGTHINPTLPMKSFLIEKAEIGWATGTFAISGNFQLPEGYPKADLDRSAVLGIQIAGAVGTDEVAFMDLGQAWAYMEGGFNGGSGQGINITKFDISWSYLANSFSIKGDLSLPGVGPGTLPREAAVSLQLGGAPPVVGEATIGFEKQDAVWYCGSAPGNNKPIADNPTGQWDFWLDEPSDFEDPGVWDDPWPGGLPDFEGSGGFEDMWLGDMLLYFEDSGTSEDPWFSELLWPLP